VEGKINNHPIEILIDSIARHSYINPNIVEIFHLQRIKHKKYLLVQLDTWAKRKINELVKDCPIDMNGINIKVDANIIPMGSYDCQIGMDWLEKHRVVLDFYSKEIICLDEEGHQGKVQGITRVVAIREILSMQLKKSFRKGCHIFVAHMEEEVRDKVESIKYHPVLRDFGDFFGKKLGLTTKRDIDLCIDLVPGSTLVSKTPYRMGTPELKELQIQLEELLRKGYIHPSVSPWGAPILFVKKKYGTLRLCIDFR
jgi:hypothetical protein